MSAGKSHHLRNPVTGDVKRLKPFKANYTRSVVGFAEADLLYALPKSADERIGRCRRIRRRADAHDVIHDVGERVWVERDNGWCMSQRSGGFDNFVIIESTNVAKTLSDNELRRACPQRLFVDQVQSLAGFQELRDLAIDLVAEKTMAVDGAVHHDQIGRASCRERV